MRNKTWTTKELEILSCTHLSDEAVAEKINRTPDSVRRARERRGWFQPKITAIKPTTVAEDVEKHDERYWEDRHNALSKKYDKLAKGEAVVDRLVSQIANLAPRSYSPAPTIAAGATPKTTRGRAQSAVLMFSDTHIGKVTSPKQTLAFGEYNFPIFLARLKYMEEAILSIVKNHVSTAVPELVIAMLGDMLDGSLGHSNEVGQLDPLFNQYYCGAHAVAQFLRNIAPHFPVVRIKDVVGNHTRFQNQKRMPTKNRYSNFDKFFYALVRELVRDITNIEWTLDAQPYAIFDVQGFTFFCAHGDSLRGGDKNLGIPNHAVGRLVSTASQLMTKHRLPAPNYYLVGHLHRGITLPHATGAFIVNGGFPGVDEFGLSEMFTPADPSQKLFFIHPQYGRTASYDISLKFAKVGEQAPYTIPAEFTMN